MDPTHPHIQPSEGVIVPPLSASQPKWQQSVKKTFRPTNILLTLSLILTLAVAQFIANPVSLLTRAANGTAAVTFQPPSSTLPPNKTYQLWITTDTPVGFIRVSVSFDKSKLMLTQNPSVVIPGFNIVTQTTAEDANATGTILFVAGLDPAQLSNAPKGTFQFANIPLAAKTSQSSSTTGHIEIADSQIVDTSAAALDISGTDAVITIQTQTTAAPTPTTVITPTPTRKPTNTPTPAPNEPTRTPTATVRPTPIPTPVQETENTPPVITTDRLPDGIENVRYPVRITVTDVDMSQTLSLSAEDLPPGLSLGTCSQRVNSRLRVLRLTCPINGTPSKTGLFHPTFTAKDSAGGIAIRTYNLTVTTWRDFFRSYFSSFRPKSR